MLEALVVESPVGPPHGEHTDGDRWSPIQDRAGHTLLDLTRKRKTKCQSIHTIRIPIQRKPTTPELAQPTYLGTKVLEQRFEDVLLHGRQGALHKTTSRNELRPPFGQGAGSGWRSHLEGFVGKPGEATTTIEDR